MEEKIIQSEKKENILGTEKIGKLLAKFAIPGIISMVVNSLYNIVDQIFIGQGVGYLGNGATSVIFPMATFAMAFALLFGDGAAAYMSLKLGEKDEDEAARGTAAGLIGITVSGIIIAIFYLIFLRPLCRVFGASDGILPYAIDYGRIIAFGLPLSAICAGGASIIRADGSPKFNMIGLFTGTIINVYDRMGSVDNTADDVLAESFRVVIFGDVNGDAIIRSVDSTIVDDEVYGFTSWSDEMSADYCGYMLFAADLDKNGIISSTDAANIDSKVAGVTTIDQVTGTIKR